MSVSLTIVASSPITVTSGRLYTANDYIIITSSSLTNLKCLSAAMAAIVAQSVILPQ